MNVFIALKGTHFFLLHYLQQYFVFRYQATCISLFCIQIVIFVYEFIKNKLGVLIL